MNLQIDERRESQFSIDYKYLFENLLDKIKQEIDGCRIAMDNYFEESKLQKAKGNHNLAHYYSGKDIQAHCCQFHLKEILQSYEWLKNEL